MNVTVAPRGILQIDDARITFRNFRGEKGMYNAEGDRSFALVIPDEELANRLSDEGWNVKIRPARTDDEEPFMYLNVKVKFNDYGPNVYLITNGRKTKLDENSVGILDRVTILSCDMDIRPYDWEVRGNSGRTAYLSAIRVIQDADRFSSDDQYTDDDF